MLFILSANPCISLRTRSSSLTRKLNTMQRISSSMSTDSISYSVCLSKYSSAISLNFTMRGFCPSCKARRSIPATRYKLCGKVLTNNTSSSLSRYPIRKRSSITLGDSSFSLRSVSPGMFLAAFCRVFRRISGLSVGFSI